MILTVHIENQKRNQFFKLGNQGGLRFAPQTSLHETIPSCHENVFDIRAWLESNRFLQNLLVDFFIHIERRIHIRLNWLQT